MDMIDLELLAFCTKRANHDSIVHSVGRSLFIKESWLLFAAMTKYYEHYDVDEIDQKEFKVWFRIKAHPELKREQHEFYSTIIDNVFETEIPEGPAFRDAIQGLQDMQFLELLLTDIKGGKTTLEEGIDKLFALGEKDKVDTTDEDISVTELHEHVRHGGLYWRLEDLNRSIGPIARGDFVVVGKRPEVGGTSFVCSELTYFLEQMPPGKGKIILFSNEEEPWKVKSRIISTALNVDYLTLLKDPSKYQDEWVAWLDGRQFKLVHDTAMTVASVRAKLIKEKPDAFGINVLLKVGGTGKDQDHDKLQELGERFRVLAGSYGPVLGIVQADPTADGMKFIPQTLIYKSKTALQGEADVLIMIGTDEEIVDHRRYVHVAKNKIPPSDCTEMRNKHIKSEVKFDISSGRFSSVNFKKHSRSKGHVYDTSV